jgi:DNA-directed RNA polymerase subunit H (RpoH/RPB5)
MEDADTRDLIVRSRSTILEIIENRGYNVDSYKGVSPVEIDKFAMTNTNLLQITADKIKDGFAPLDRIVVLYWLEPVKNKLETELKKLWDEGGFDVTKQELVVILSEPPHEAFALQAAKQWTLLKARISFFHLKQIISNPASHCMVPPHRKLSETECEFVMKKLKLKSKSELPHIKYHDIQARVLGLVPGDIVEIRRPSETVGEYTLFRICTI